MFSYQASQKLKKINKSIRNERRQTPLGASALGGFYLSQTYESLKHVIKTPL
jgi:hypothetical protein